MSQTKENENPIVFLRKVYMDIILNEIEESRITHRLGGDTKIAEPEEGSPLSVAAPVSAERIEKLELAVELLQNELEDLKKSFRIFKEQKASK
jgi:hypothetical protein